MTLCDVTNTYHAQQQQQQQTIKQHNPYAASVIPENPEATLRQREAAKVQQQFAQYQQILYQHAMYARAEVFPPYLSFPGFYDEAPQSPLQPPQSPPSPQSSGTLKKMYVGGRPVPVQAASSEKPMVHVEAIPEEPTITAALVVTVQFRREDKEFTLKKPASVFPHPTKRNIIGAHVIVDGDRGEDLGRITALREMSGNNETNNEQVRRAATRDEVESVSTALRQEELEAKQFANDEAERLLPGRLTIEDATFQFDRQKLTLWYRSPDRVYFVSLLKALNQQYRCRIWMERVEGTEPASPKTK